MKAQTQGGVKAVDQSQTVETVKESLLRRWVYIQVRVDSDWDNGVPEWAENLGPYKNQGMMVTFDYRFVQAVDEDHAYAIGQEHMQMDGVINDYVIDVDKP